MSFDESTARDLNPAFEESTATEQDSSNEVDEAHDSQHSNHENTTLTTETPETTALATENSQLSSAELETADHHGSESQREEMDFAAALERPTSMLSWMSDSSPKVWCPSPKSSDATASPR